MNSFLVILVFISLSFVYGTSTDEVDCGPVCMVYCHYGNVMDERGCPLCKCNPAPVKEHCEKPVCNKDCLHGYVDDGDGCPTCECITPQ
ncbi:BPTI/Kunitz domain-containing protein 4-like [Pecten maximus]|uniref:BPTI/Kunitz domain-containing protein 4-like n=1 Tax=Pecten maximus TaxID=6579 RepID=UPI001458499B|nr:BPTI/Kunitz domain-containing protein 4-like [Pecten maximus]